jgi:hypothetical protein
MDDPVFEKVRNCLIRWIVNGPRTAQQSAKLDVVPSHPSDPSFPEYKAQSDAHKQAQADLWMATDFEYDDSPFRSAVWNWRYWKVMVRKCCWYQLNCSMPRKASRVMSKKQRAEDELIRVCGLDDIYRSPCSYIKEKFEKV